jgi:hypothetical protein
VLELADVGAVGDAGAEVAVHRDRAVEDPGRRLGVDRHQRPSAGDRVALVAQAGDRAGGRGGHRRRVGEAERAVDVLAGDEVAALHRDRAERHGIVGGPGVAAVAGREQEPGDDRDPDDRGGRQHGPAAAPANPRETGGDAHLLSSWVLAPGPSRSPRK